MRTKLLFLAAAAAAITTVSAQVYSVNVVGYINVTVNPGFTMIANQLDAGAGLNVISNLFKSVPEGTTIFKYDSGTGQYKTIILEFGAWNLPNETLAPGEGVFIQNLGAAAFTVTFVGEVKQGTLTTTIPAGFSILSSQVPQQAQLDDGTTPGSGLGFPVVEGDTVFMFNNATKQYSTHIFEFGAWSLAPTPKVGEAFFVNKKAATTWTRTFNVQ